MSKSTSLLFKGLKIVAWVIFVGLCIESGALIVNFFFSLYNPELVQKLYQKLDLSEMYELSKWAFFSMYSLALLISILKAYLFYLVIKLVSKFDLSKPYHRIVLKQISQISYLVLSIGILSYLARQISIRLDNQGYNIDQLHHFWGDSKAFVLLGAVIYIIAIIFSKGVEYQEELEETV